MNFELQRSNDAKKCTLGRLRAVDAGADWLMYTLEPEAGVRMPAGRYPFKLTKSGRSVKGELWSPDPDHMLPEIGPVPGHTGVRAHAGNHRKDTVLCVIVGYAVSPETPDTEAAIGDSRHALRDLVETLWNHADADCYITIKDPS